MNGLHGRLRREFRTLEVMVAMACRERHGARGEAPCAACREFLGYAAQRLRRCPYGELKPTCERCPVHCYKPPRRDEARAIMRLAGPQMARRHPWLALLHLRDGLRRVAHPLALRRRSRRP